MADLQQAVEHELISVRQILDGPVAGFASDKKTWVLQLNSNATLRQLHRFVVEKLKVGLHYCDPPSRALAAVLFAAAVHPQYRYVETGRNDPIWLSKLMALKIFPIPLTQQDHQTLAKSRLVL